MLELIAGEGDKWKLCFLIDSLGGAQRDMPRGGSGQWCRTVLTTIDHHKVGELISPWRELCETNLSGWDFKESSG